MQKAFEDLERAVFRLLRRIEQQGSSARPEGDPRQAVKRGPDESMKSRREAAELVRRALSRLKSL